MAFGLVMVCFAAALAAPLLVLLWAPLLLGVPHVASDLRHLVHALPGGWDRRALAGVAAGLGGQVLLRVAAVLGAPRMATAEVACGCAAVLAALLLTPAPVGRRVAASLLLAPVLALALAQPAAAALLLGHLHNGVALLALVWFARWRDRPGPAIQALGASVLGAAFILGGGADGVAGGSLEGFSFAGLVQTLAPGVPDPWAGRLVLLFGFAQLVHYAVWLALLPRLREGEGIAAVPAWAWGALVVASVALPLVGIFDPVGTRATYLSLVLFHGWLELAALAALLLAPPSGSRVAAAV